MILRYTTDDFELVDGLEVSSVNTLMQRNPLNNQDVKNHLITHWEEAKITHDGQSDINYRRINHLDFKYQISIKNPNNVRKKVIVRLWLGSSSDEGDIRLVAQII